MANSCWDRVLSEICEENISEIVEPSCGNGSFYHHKTHEPHFGYDIHPECDRHGIIQADYLKAPITYLEGRLVIGNPPYGRCLNLAQKFYKKSTQIADYIAFILPIGQLNNNRSLYEFDLIYSEDLGLNTYTDRELHCCFNIYKRPPNDLNKRTNERLEDISIYRQDSKRYKDREFDIRMCYWGDGTAGKVLSEHESYSAEYKIKIHNDELKPQIVKLLNEFDWQSYLKCIAMRKIQQFHIVDILREHIPEVK